MTSLLGGVFDPPHNGHVALAREVERRFADQLVVLVAGRPAHKQAQASAHTRLRLAEAAFAPRQIALDEHSRTVDTLRAGPWRDPLFVVGADEFIDFPQWKDPDGVLDLARLAVATRPGSAAAQLASVRERLRRRERVEFFELDPMPLSSRAIREHVRLGEPIDDLVPPGVAELIRELGLYRR